MKEVNLLGLKVVGLTVVVLVVLFGLYWGGRLLLSPGARLGDDGPASGQSLVDSQRDTDGDGMADFYEVTYYHTDPNNPDTDGDGVNDLQEVTSGRDPVIAGPQDESKPTTGSAVADVDTYTGQYLAGLPDDAARGEILDQSRLEAFVESSRESLLPEIPVEELHITELEGEGAVSDYLDAISSAHNSSIQPVTSADLEAAFRLQINSSNGEPMRLIVDALDRNLTTLKLALVPAETTALHTRLLAASQALRDNATLLRDIDDDFVGGLVAAKNIEDLGAIFQEIAADVQSLEEKYGLE